MTWRQLLEQLQNMEKIGHSSLDKSVEVIDTSGDCFELDILESLTTGDVYFMNAIVRADDAE